MIDSFPTEEKRESNPPLTPPFQREAGGDNSLQVPPKPSRFLDLNQQTLAELITFLDFAEGFTLGFVEINFPPDLDCLLETLKNHSQCQQIQLEILDFSNCPDLRFLRDEIVQKLSEIERDGDKKLVLAVRGLEKSIGVVGDYPPLLQDLNFVRDAYQTSVPHPLLFVLSDYAITRIAKFAPDFWAWRSGVFLFRTPPAMRDHAFSQSLDFADSGVPESQERIELLEQLLQEYRPSPGHPDTPTDHHTCNTILHQLGVAYLSRHELGQAEAYLNEAKKLARHRKYLQAEVDYGLGRVYLQQGQLRKALRTLEACLDRFRQLGDTSREADSLNNLGIVYDSLGRLRFPGPVPRSDRLSEPKSRGDPKLPQCPPIVSSNGTRSKGSRL